ncbi:MAG: DUF433 domain-containing protein [Planctomycetia bacterium]|nr:DUF433 domain-containing protein [Planctomycetia bacterium]
MPNTTLVPSGTPHILLDERGRGWIEGTGTKVIEVVLDHIGPDQMPAEQIHAQRPHLTLDQIKAALNFYKMNRAAVDEEIRLAEEQYRDIRSKTENKESQARLRELKQQATQNPSGSE